MIGCNLELLKKNMLMVSKHCTHSSEYHERMGYGRCNGRADNRTYFRIDALNGLERKDPYEALPYQIRHIDDSLSLHRAPDMKSVSRFHLSHLSDHKTCNHQDLQNRSRKHYRQSLIHLQLLHKSDPYQDYQDKPIHAYHDANLNNTFQPQHAKLI